ncbi:MAG: DJ-1/PfpI family protein [Deltaproteobacteria bacterium]|nr:DJ-1/PfpI family protein [Deltaproteobacteria bacterium]
MDNDSAHAAKSYEQEIIRTIPFHAELYNQAIDLVKAIKPTPRRWLDTGCGPGIFVEQTMQTFAATEYVLADPSVAMLNLARERFTAHANISFVNAGSCDLPRLESFDVITAILCHHYGSIDDRKKCLNRCRELIGLGGILLVFENVRAETDNGNKIQRQRWGAWQRDHGRAPAAVEKTLNQIEVNDYDAVMFVGGPGCRQYFEDAKAHQIANAFQQAGKLLTAICSAPVTLARAGLLHNKNATVFPSDSDELVKGGANYHNEAVVVDGNLITGNGPQAAEAFANQVIAVLNK